MGTTTIGLRDEVYRRLDARSRGDESFSDTIDRLMDETVPDWEENFGVFGDDFREDVREADGSVQHEGRS